MKHTVTVNGKQLSEIFASFWHDKKHHIFTILADVIDLYGRPVGLIWLWSILSDFFQVRSPGKGYYRSHHYRNLSLSEAPAFMRPFYISGTDSWQFV